MSPGPEKYVLFFKFYVYVCLHACVYMHVCAGAWGDQKKELLWSLSSSCETPACCRCWQQNSSPLEKRQALFTIEPSLQVPGCSHSEQKKLGGQEMKGVSSLPLERPQPASLVQQALTCIFYPIPRLGTHSSSSDLEGVMASHSRMGF